MMKLCSDVLAALSNKTLATAESCTGGMIGAMLTAVPGASRVYKGGIISYWSEIKEDHLNVSAEDLILHGPVSYVVAKAMAAGARESLHTDCAISVTGLAGPDGDAYGHPVGTVFIGYSSSDLSLAREYHFSGDRNSVRQQAATAALELLLTEVSNQSFA